MDKTVRGFSIKEIAGQTGLTEDTIRYYEKIGLIPRADRKKNSHRVYRAEDADMLKIILCLKKTGMSLDEMKPFLDLSSQDDLSSFPELVDMLQGHKDKIKSQIASLQQIVDLIDSKMLRQGFGKQDECTLTKEASLRQSTYF